MNEATNGAVRPLVTLMDTTLRDGEQTHGVSIPGHEKLILAQRLLTEVRVNRIEVASCRVSKGEHESLRRIMEWAASEGLADAIEVLSFVDGKASVDWLTSAGCRAMNLLTKGSLRHCELQLRKTPEQHLEDIRQTLDYAREKGVRPMIYLEDWSNGVLHSPDYVWLVIEHYVKWGFDRIHLCDTLGILNPWQVRETVAETVRRFPEGRFEFHGHNDYGLATVNAVEAVRAGAVGIHVTVNGLGERAGNASLAEVVACVRDHTDYDTAVDETKLKGISRLVETFSGKRIGANVPVVGNDVFTQTAGIHADGDKKGNLYESRLTPARFARDRVYALGKLSGRSNLDFNLDKLNLQLSPEQRKQLLDKVVELGDKKKVVTTEDLPFIISDLLSTPEQHDFEVVECVISTTYTMSPTANVRVRYRGEEYESVASGSGGYDAFMTALRQLSPRMNITIPKLQDFEIHIPPGGRTNALVEATITWEGDFKTRAVSSDQVLAAIKATERMLNLISRRESGLYPNLMGEDLAEKAAETMDTLT